MFHNGIDLRSNGRIEDWLRGIPTDGSIVVWGESHKHMRALRRHAPDAKIVQFRPTKDTYDRWKSQWTEVECAYHVTAIPHWKANYYNEWVKFLNLYGADYQTMILDTITAARFGYEWSRNYIHNMRHIPESYPVRSLFRLGLDVIVVGTGPSLEDSLDDLREAKGRALIIAAGSALRKLLDEGVEPDLAVVFDGGLANYKCHFEGLESDVPLIYDPMVHHKITDTYSGPKILMSVWPNDALLVKPLGRCPGFCHIGPSVSNTIVNMGVQFGASKILLVGQDMAVKTEDGKDISHARGSNFLNTDLKPTTQHFFEVPGRYGKVKSTMTLNAFNRTLRGQAKQISKRGVEVVNCSKYGATVDGVRWSDLNDELDRDVCIDGDLQLGEKIGRRGSIIRHLALARSASSRLESLIEGMDEKWINDELTPAIMAPDFGPYYFVLNAVWDGIKRRKGEAWVKNQLRRSLKYLNPKIRSTISDLSKG